VTHSASRGHPVWTTVSLSFVSRLLSPVVSPRKPVSRCSRLSPVSQRPILYMCRLEHDPILCLPQSHLEACLLIPIPHPTPTMVCSESLALILLFSLFRQRLDTCYRNSLQAFIYSLSSKLPAFHPLSPIPNKNNHNKFPKHNQIKTQIPQSTTIFLDFS